MEAEPEEPAHATHHASAGKSAPEKIRHQAKKHELPNQLHVKMGQLTSS
jgi:hypothetical protein